MFLKDCLYLTPNKLYLLQLKILTFPITLHKEHQKYRTFNTVTPNEIKQI